VSDMVCETHAAIISQAKGAILNLVTVESVKASSTVAQIAEEERAESIMQSMGRLKSVGLDGIKPSRISKILLPT